MDEEVKEKIVQGAEELFMRYGVKSVTMDDLAANLSVSKKTIYQHFKDKDELVLCVAHLHMELDQKELEKITDKSENAVQELFFMVQFIRNITKKMNPSVLFDLKKYHSKAWEAINTHKVCCIYDRVVSNLEQGKKEGYFRKEINSEILATMRMQSTEMGYDPLIYSPTKYNIIDVQMELFEHFLMGIVTPAGLELYNNYIVEIK